MRRYDSINSEFFIDNRKKLGEKIKPNSVVLVFANFQMPRNGDQYFIYRQNSDFFYLTGIEQEKSILLLVPDALQNNLKEVLFILKSNEALERWEGHKITESEATEISGIRTIKVIDEFESTLHSLMTVTENVYLNIPESPKFQPEVESRDLKLANFLRTKYPAYHFERLAPIMQLLRIKKSSVEINLIKKAITITNNSFRQVLKELKPGMKEYEIEAIISHEFIRSGASGHAYAPIIAGGKNACTLHYIENNNSLHDGDLLLMDFGAEYANYASDLSRTIPINGKFSKRQKECYEAVFRIFCLAKSLMKPGININEIHKEVCKSVEEEHIRLGLYTKNDVNGHKGENPLWYNYYMHGTSHFLGLDVHDVGTRDTLLEEGMVITCEPGIYIAKEGIGIRIENNLLITSDGNIDLMEEIPVEAYEIEPLMSHS
jgi:Xaa-Pro aminopeptidase